LLTFEDLLAAKVAIQMGLIGPDSARTGLQGALKSGRTLVQELEATQVLDPEKAKVVAAHARRCSFLKAESTYLSFLRQKKLVDEANIEKVRKRQYHEALRSRLGVLLVQEGKLAADVDQTILGEARASFIADNAQVTERYAARSFEGIERPSVTVSEVIAQAPALTDSKQGTPSPLASPNDSRHGRSVAPLPPPNTAKVPDFVPMGDAGPGGDLFRMGHTVERAVPSAALQAQMLASPPIPAPPADPGPLRGTGLEDRYAVIKKVGEGGMGAVYLASEIATGRKVALKLVLDQEKSKEAALRFKREILATSMCGHENIIEIYDAGETKDGSYFMAMEYVPGEELSDIVKKEGAVPVARSLDLFEQILEGIAAVHSADIVHRDLKPQNFRVWKDEETGKERLKIMDFGIARVRNADQEQFGDAFYKTMGGKITGSPAYIAPESITEPDVDGRADLYSLGIACFRMVTGKLPFSCKDPMEYLPKHLYAKPPVPSEFLPGRGITPELDALILKLLEKRPEARFQTAGEVLVALREKVRPSVAPAGASSGGAAGSEFNSAEVTRPNMTAPAAANTAPSSPVETGDPEKTVSEPAPATAAGDAATLAPSTSPTGEASPRPRAVEPSEKKGCLGFLFGRKKS
jgi:serine/threonine-protein kinase